MTGSQLLLIVGIIYLTSYHPDSKVTLLRTVMGFSLTIVSLILELAK